MRASPRPNVVGPVPKRSEDRIRYDGNVIDKVHAFGVVKKPDLGLGEFVHPIIVDFWDSVGESAQSRYYEASDWQYLRTCLHFLNQLLNSNKPSAQMLTVVNQMLTDLLVSEGSRRRVRMEIERNTAKEGAEVKSLSDYFQNLAKNNDLGDMFNYA
jgi:hypothetical protein